ncbi:hypothetical protein Brsp03_00098 [Brucella sp. NBRC 12951]|jgi:hypothetical protein|nr:hypothetical protein DR92_2130 [Brucella anthropi]SUA61590.1 Uncharacterised protein [Brucella anthropi]
MHSRCAEGWVKARGVKSWETVKYNSRFDASHGLKYCYFTVVFVDLSQLRRLFVLIYFVRHLREEAFDVKRAAQMTLGEMLRRTFQKGQCANATVLAIACHPFQEAPVETLHTTFRHIRA